MQNLNYGVVEDIEEQQEKIKTTQKTTQKVLSVLKENPSVSRKEIAEILENITPDGVKYHINKLRKAGIIERVGTDNGRYWKVNE